MPYVIGVTGAVGAGKSSVLRWLVKRGIPAIDADLVVHGLLSDDAETIRAVAARFDEVQDGRRGIDRAALASHVFRSSVELEALEQLLHPRVIQVVEDWISSGLEQVVAVEAVKLVESGMHLGFDETWIVTCESEARRLRLAKRGWSAAEIARRMTAAPPDLPRLAVATRVIDNGGSNDATERQLERALHAVRAKLEAMT